MKNYDYIYERLNEVFPNAECELDYKDAFSLLIAVILSAQCTDKRVNMVTPVLFKKYPTAKELASANQKDVEQIIHSCGFYVNKSKNIINCSKDIVERFDGNVPSTFDELMTLSGVGRKTANVVLSTVYNTPAIAVDTHVFRVSNRLGIAKAKNVEECERQLMKNFKKENWSKLHHLLVLFGRYNCKSQNPKCEKCVLKDVCEDMLCKNK